MNGKDQNNVCDQGIRLNSMPQSPVLRSRIPTLSKLPRPVAAPMSSFPNISNDLKDVYSKKEDKKNILSPYSTQPINQLTKPKTESVQSNIGFASTSRRSLTETRLQTGIETTQSSPQNYNALIIPAALNDAFIEETDETLVSTTDCKELNEKILQMEVVVNDLRRDRSRVSVHRMKAENTVKQLREELSQVRHELKETQTRFDIYKMIDPKPSDVRETENDSDVKENVDTICKTVEKLFDTNSPVKNSENFRAKLTEKDALISELNEEINELRERVSFLENNQLETSITIPKNISNTENIKEILAGELNPFRAELQANYDKLLAEKVSLQIKLNTANDKVRCGKIILNRLRTERVKLKAQTKPKSVVDATVNTDNTDNLDKNADSASEMQQKLQQENQMLKVVVTRLLQQPLTESIFGSVELVENFVRSLRA